MPEEIDVVAIFYPKPDKTDELVAGLDQLAKHVKDNEPDTLRFYSVLVPEKQEILIVERYRNKAALKSHMKTAYFREFASSVPKMCRKPAEAKMGNRVSLSTTGAKL